MKPRAAGPWGQAGMMSSRQRGDRELKPLFVHTVELPKYSLYEATIREAPKIEQWMFLLLYAD